MFRKLPNSLKTYYINTKTEQRELIKKMNKIMYGHKEQNEHVFIPRRTSETVVSETVVSETVFSETVVSEVSFKTYSKVIRGLNLDLETVLKLSETFKHDKTVYKVFLTVDMLEKLSLGRLFYKNGLTKENNIRFSFKSVERFFNWNGLYYPFDLFRKNFLLDSIICLKETLWHDKKINVLFVNKVTYNLINKLLDLNKMYGIPQSEKKGLYNVFQHSDNNRKHYLLSVDNINFKAINHKNGLNYSVLEQIENYYINLNDLKTEEKVILIENIKQKEKQNRLDYINNLTFEDSETTVSDYDINYKANYKGLNYKYVIETLKTETKVSETETTETETTETVVSEKLQQLLDILKDSY